MAHLAQGRLKNQTPTPLLVERANVRRITWLLVAN